MLGWTELYVANPAALSLDCRWLSESTECLGATLHCMADYMDSCPLTLVSGYDEWQCNGTNGTYTKTCHDYTFPIICDTTHPCHSSYSCMADIDCTIYCTGGNVCENAKFYCAENVDCTVHANGAYAMKNAQIYGAANSNLFVISDGSYVHFSGEIYCPTNADCVITALTGNSNLFYATVDARYSNLLNITNTQTTDNLVLATIYCPPTNCNIKVSNNPNRAQNVSEQHCIVWLITWPRVL
eukprot:1013586_1